MNQITDIHYDDVFMTFTEHPRLIHLLSQFIGDEMRIMNSMFINKPPGTGRHPPHQNLYYFPFRPIDKIIVAWTAIDETIVENGCLYVVPRSYKKNTLYEHEKTKNYRKSITAHYASASCVYEDVRGGVQGEIAQEVENESSRRGYRLDFEDIWRFKSKEVPTTQSKV